MLRIRQDNEVNLSKQFFQIKDALKSRQAGQFFTSFL